MNLHVQWIVGFVDGEGCFTVSINANKGLARKKQVLPEFVVVQHRNDVQILHELKTFFGCGVVRRNHGDRDCYRVRSISHLNEIIIPFFLKHGLKTKKNVDFKKFKEIIDLMVEKKHLTEKGIDQISAIMATMNNRGKAATSSNFCLMPQKHG